MESKVTLTPVRSEQQELAHDLFRRSERAFPGYRTTVALLSVGQLVSWAVLYYMFTSFVQPMQDALGWSQPTLMGAFTCGLAVWGLSTYAVGAAIDRGHGRAVMSGGSALAGLGFLLWSQVTEPWVLYGAWALMGAAMAMNLYEPAFNVLTRQFPDRYREGITALTLVGGFASTLAFPAAAALLGSMSWRTALMVIGAVMLLVIAPLHGWALRGSGALVRSNPAPGGNQAVLRSAGAGLQEQPAYTFRDAVRQPSFWLVMGTFMLYSFAAAALWAHAMPALAAKGLSIAEAIAVLIWVGPAQVAGRLLFFAAGKGMSARALGLTVLGGLPLSFAIFAFSSSTAGLIVFAILFGIANGLVTIVRGSLVPEYFGRGHVGRIGGAISAVALLARAAAPLATAWLLLLPMSYEAVMIALSALGFLAVSAFAVARPPGHRGSR